ncbi:hypothetical protein I8752_33615 [Nostocaceae cyanobacterium CENA369]|uniref:Uncharacterized protein n=1 Tax=Dendronalium phyllosphericum CENA369 TaxID=1725256 RepID=A0A8J7I812_9NOST|nr:hypothetical protein [Dendronalium phyllosphericum]MBH8577816.1 hypothetical protein [Dendronalium phyllosphericum CENA369]
MELAEFNVLSIKLTENGLTAHTFKRYNLSTDAIAVKLGKGSEYLEEQTLALFALGEVMIDILIFSSSKLRANNSLSCSNFIN